MRRHSHTTSESGLPQHGGHEVLDLREGCWVDERTCIAPPSSGKRHGDLPFEIEVLLTADLEGARRRDAGPA